MNLKKLLTLLAAAALLGVMPVAWPARNPAAQASQQPDRISLDDLKALLASGKPVLILDVRNEVGSKIKGAVHIPLDQVEARVGEIPRDREVVTYCA